MVERFSWKSRAGQRARLACVLADANAHIGSVCPEQESFTECAFHQALCDLDLVCCIRWTELHHVAQHDGRLAQERLCDSSHDLAPKLDTTAALALGDREDHR